jgi:hypothetical protein
MAADLPVEEFEDKAAEEGIAMVSRQLLRGSLRPSRTRKPSRRRAQWWSRET